MATDPPEPQETIEFPPTPTLSNAPNSSRHASVARLPPPSVISGQSGSSRHPSVAQVGQPSAVSGRSGSWRQSTFVQVPPARVRLNRPPSPRPLIAKRSVTFDPDLQRSSGRRFPSTSTQSLGDQIRSISGQAQRNPDPSNPAASSTQLPEEPQAPRFASITFHGNDLIRFTNFPEEDFIAVRVAIASPPNSVEIKGTRGYDGYVELCVEGRPWMNWWPVNDAPRLLVLGIIETLFNMAWKLEHALDICPKTGNKGIYLVAAYTLVFKKQDNIPLRRHWICISFDKKDKLKIVGAPPQDLTQEILNTQVMLIWDRGDPDISRAEQTFKIHMLRDPWTAEGEKALKTQRVLFELLEILEARGYEVYATLQLKGDGMADIMVCHRAVDWIAAN
ncbi:hypothetical protein F66182_6033 [Fusarium sp. NRRL 66182]|nr:hypothetical protein F66182_6033 [Fusarium sp. NRRL 66182]